MNFSGLTFENILEVINTDYFKEAKTFSFRMYGAYDPCPMLLLSSKIRELRKDNKDDIIHIDIDELCSYPGTMGFFKSISENITFGKKPGEARGSENYYPITHLNYFNVPRIEYEEEIEEESLKIASILTKNENNKRIIKYMLKEMIRNCIEHGRTRDAWVCVQRWPSYKLTEIAILDEGIGIKNSLISNRVYSDISDDLSAILESVKPGITECFGKKQNQYGEYANFGYGLYFTKELSIQLNGNFSIVSGRKCVTFNRDGKKVINTNFNGTAIRIRIKDIGNEDLSSLLKKINEKGKALASTNPNANKTASGSSLNI